MKHVILFCLLQAIVGAGLAQKPTATFFSEDGHKFWVIMDGIKKNEAPAYRVDNVELEHDWAKVKIIFENPEIPELEKTIQGVDVDGKPVSAIWAIKKTDRGKWVIRVSSFAELPPQPGAVGQPVNPATPTQYTTKEDVPVSETPSPSGHAGFNVEINITDPTLGVNTGINMNVYEEQQATQTHETVTNISNMPPPPYEEPAQSEKQTVASNCIQAAANDDFESMKQSIAAKSFEDSKLTVAKQILKANCLSATQVRDIMELFSFESTKVEFAKLAYPKTVDKNNFFKIYDVFSFESSIDEVDQYIDRLR